MDPKTTGATAAVGGYTESQLSVGITDLHCNGSEASILNCSHNNLEEYNCASRDDAGVICQGQLLLSVAIIKQSLTEWGNDNTSRWYCIITTIRGLSLLVNIANQRLKVLVPSW